MPTEVVELFDLVKLGVPESVTWGTRVAQNGPGVYVVALRSKAAEAPLCAPAVHTWLDIATRMTIDGGPANPSVLSDRLGRFWLPDEEIVYIGQTGKQSIRRRLGQFYRHVLGRNGPHCGGSWVKALNVLDETLIYWAPCEAPGLAESLMLKAFADSRGFAWCHDSSDIGPHLPFANLEIIWNLRRYRKQHGLKYWHM